MDLAVVFDLVVALGLDHRTIAQRKLVGSALKVLLFDENALKCLRIETESRAALEPFLMGIQINILEVLIGSGRAELMIRFTSRPVPTGTVDLVTTTV